LYELYKYIQRNYWTPYFTLPRIRAIAHQCLTALAFIHANNLIHCDLKPENILIKSLSKCIVKVIDFGSSCFRSDPHSSYVQSRSYRAPEVVLGLPYNAKIDVFSLGCILAELHRGRVLFSNKTVTHLLAGHTALCGEVKPWMIDEGKHAHLYFRRRQLYMWQEEPSEAGLQHDERHGTPTSQRRQRHVEHGTGRYCYVHPRRRTFEAELGTDDALFVDFIRQLLTLDLHERPSAEQALRHPWITEKRSCEAEAAEEGDGLVCTELVQSLQSVRGVDLLTRLGLEVVSFGVTPAEFKRERLAFMRMDTDGSGTVSRAEFVAALASRPELPSAAAESIFDELDRDASGHIEFNEFCAACVRKRLRAGRTDAQALHRNPTSTQYIYAVQ